MEVAVQRANLDRRESENESTSLPVGSVRVQFSVLTQPAPLRDTRVQLTTGHGPMFNKSDKQILDDARLRMFYTHINDVYFVIANQDLGTKTMLFSRHE